MQRLQHGDDDTAPADDAVQQPPSQVGAQAAPLRLLAPRDSGVNVRGRARLRLLHRDLYVTFHSARQAENGDEAAVAPRSRVRLRRHVLDVLLLGIVIVLLSALHFVLTEACVSLLHIVIALAAHAF